jgi:hypothetical protein
MDSIEQIPATSPTTEFDMSPFTTAPLMIDMQVRFEGKTPAEVFEIMGDPARITDWYLLAKDVHIPAAASEDLSGFEVEFMMFGRVKEEILHWDLPSRYVYRAFGEHFPIKDYIALIEIQKIGDNRGIMIWRQFFGAIDGLHNQRILPVILPPLNRASLDRLALLIGGTEVIVRDYMSPRSPAQ